LKYWIWQAKQS